MRTILRHVAMGILWLSGASLAFAQHEGHQTAAQSVQTQTDQRLIALVAEVERLNLVIERARQTNDPAKMRAAIDELQNSLAAVRANLLVVSPAGNSDEMPMTPGTPAAMDHSKMSMPGMTPPPKSPPASGKTKEMDHSKMSMPEMNAPAQKAQPPSPSPGGKEMSQVSPQANTKDPVCGMEVETQAAEKATYQGKTYYFCSRADREKFLSDPAKYVNR
jgi:YHS domain-containing protein